MWIKPLKEVCSLSIASLFSNFPISFLDDR